MGKTGLLCARASRPVVQRRRRHHLPKSPRITSSGLHGGTKLQDPRGLLRSLPDDARAPSYHEAIDATGEDSPPRTKGNKGGVRGKLCPAQQWHQQHRPHPPLLPFRGPLRLFLPLRPRGDGLPSGGERSRQEVRLRRSFFSEAALEDAPQVRRETFLAPWVFSRAERQHERTSLPPRGNARKEEGSYLSQSAALFLRLLVRFPGVSSRRCLGVSLAGPVQLRQAGLTPGKKNDAVQMRKIRIYRM